MINLKSLNILVILIIILSIIATSFGIFSNAGEGNYSHESIRGKSVDIYGKGIYQHMSADVAIQGIAQDYITLFVGIPLLIIGLIGTRRGSLRFRFLLAGTSAYFFVTYLFYMIMGMYNYLFLIYVVLLALSFFVLATTLMSFDIKNLSNIYESEKPLRFAARFLIVNVFMVAMLWLNVIIPPLINGSIYPESLQHYTTLIVQGMDLGLLLPIALVSALLLLKSRPLGYLFVPVYTIFLSIMMTALTAKLIAMGLQGQSIVPAIFFIPLFVVCATGSSVTSLKTIK